MKGHLQQRGPNTWRLKFDVGRDPGSGKRRIRYATFHGTKREAQVELARRIAEICGGGAIEPNRVSVAAYLRSWVNNAEAISISSKTAERYRQLIENQIVPHLGALGLQKLRAADLAAWHATLLRKGRSDGRPLAARTVGHAHRVLHKALQDAVQQELLTRNPFARIVPPKVQSEEVESLDADQVGMVLEALYGTQIYPHVLLLLSTGMRRGELMGLQWGDLDLEAGRLRIVRAVEVTDAHGLRLKQPKTRHGRRIISLPSIAVECLRKHRKEQLELRLKLGIGKLRSDHHIFGEMDGAVRHPGWLTDQWKGAVTSRALPKVSLHALRHSHASALIASGQDVVTVSRRLGHASPTVTLSVYAHLFHKTDETSATVMDAILKPKGNTS